MSKTCRIRVMHVASGDLWAGAEAQLSTLLRQLVRDPQIDPAVVLLNHGTLEQRLRSENLDVLVLDEHTMGSAAIVVALRRHMLAVRPQIIHTHRTKENVLGTVANLASVRVPMVRTQHGAPEHRPAPWQLHKHLYPALNVHSARLVETRVIAVSAPLARRLERVYGAHRVRTIPNGVDVDHVRGAQQLPAFRRERPQATHIGFIGRLEPVKRADLFLETAALLCRHWPARDWRFHVLGDGSLRAGLEQQAERLEIHPRVQFHGHDPNAVSRLNGLDALVICSDHEGLPMILLEALTVGVRVVAHAVGGIPAALHGEAGCHLVGDQDPQSYARVLGNLERSTRAHNELPSRHSWPFAAGVNAARTRELYLAMAAR